MDTRATHLRRALWLSALSVAWSGIVGSIAALVAITSGALSLLGFGVDAVIDAAASVTLIWRFLIEARRPGRANAVERAAERVIGLALIALAIYLLAGSAVALASQRHPEASIWGSGLLIASIIVLPWLAAAKYKVAARLESRALRLDSILTAVAALLGVISLASLAASEALGLWWADAVGALVVAAIIGREGTGSLRASEGRAEP
jgi:divalent metal cation (Fe/Co/Zn/Cd) transporter